MTVIFIYKWESTADSPSIHIIDFNKWIPKNSDELELKGILLMISNNQDKTYKTQNFYYNGDIFYDSECLLEDFLAPISQTLPYTIDKIIEFYTEWYILHLFGHVHGNYVSQGNSIDIGVDPNEFNPISLDFILEKIKNTKNEKK